VNQAAFIDKLGLLSEEEGFPQIAGRMLGFLLLNPGAHSLDRLAEALQISKTSASTNARLLEQNGMIARAAAPGDRKDYYELPTDEWEGFFTIARRRMKRLHDLMADAITELGPEQQASRRGLADVQRFYAFLLDAIDRDLERWQELNAGVETP
jgi:DNA-binding transcriptional regulator GbsR (MarR family)